MSVPCTGAESMLSGCSGCRPQWGCRGRPVLAVSISPASLPGCAPTAASSDARSLWGHGR